MVRQTPLAPCMMILTHLRGGFQRLTPKPRVKHPLFRTSTSNSAHYTTSMSSQNQDRQVDRKGKGKAKDQDERQDQEIEGRQDDQHGDKGQGEKQMKEIRRPPPLPAVKGTIGAIGA